MTIQPFLPAILPMDRPARAQAISGSSFSRTNEFSPRSPTYRRMTMKNEECPMTPNRIGGADASDSSIKHDAWTVMRMKQRNCACYPINLHFETPLSEAEVREEIDHWVRSGNLDWKEFRHFDLWPARLSSPDADSRRQRKESASANHSSSYPQ